MHGSGHAKAAFSLASRLVAVAAKTSLTLSRIWHRFVTASPSLASFSASALYEGLSYEQTGVSCSSWQGLQLFSAICVIKRLPERRFLVWMSGAEEDTLK